ncbi:MAG: lysine-2,3-aminomutase-like protein [Alphaproteobacteria bacterium]
MSNRTAPAAQPAIVHAEDLAAAGLIAPEAVAAAAAVGRRYAIRVTPAMAGLMDATAAGGDAMRRQFLPDPAELDAAPEERADPIGDDAHSPVPGLVHRYPDRALLKPISVCPVYCRFCFRRETVGAAAAMTPAEIDAALDYVAGRPEIWEVILTGGDPLMLKPASLARIVGRIEAIGHVAVLRLHTRVPVAEPARVTAELAAALRGTGRLAVYVSVHSNHPAEIGEDARAAAARLADAGLPLLAQTVLLRGVNDDVETLSGLMRALVAARIRPYYLHHPDLAPGTARFRLDIAEGQRLVAALRGRLSGLCQPTYVLDVPGGYGKAPVGPVYAAADGDRWRVRDPFGREHEYPPAVAGLRPGC